MYKIFSYFVQPKSYDGTLAAEEVNMDGDSGKLIMAVNGWVMGDDPLRNFADPGRYKLLSLYEVCANVQSVENHHAK